MNVLTALFVLCSAWEVSARLADVIFFPPCSTSLFGFDSATYLTLFCHVLISLCRVFAGLSLGGLLGATVGLYLGQHPRADKVVAPFLFLTYPFPKVVLIPILLFAFGPGEMSKLMLLAIFSFYQLTVTGRDAAKSVPTNYLVAFRTLSRSQFALYQHVIVPACLPQLFSGPGADLNQALNKSGGFHMTLQNIRLQGLHIFRRKHFRNFKQNIDHGRLSKLIVLS